MTVHTLRWKTFYIHVWGVSSKFTDVNSSITPLKLGFCTTQIKWNKKPPGRNADGEWKLQTGVRQEAGRPISGRKRNEILSWDSWHVPDRVGNGRSAKGTLPESRPFNSYSLARALQRKTKKQSPRKPNFALDLRTVAVASSQGSISEAFHVVGASTFALRSLPPPWRSQWRHSRATTSIYKLRRMSWYTCVLTLLLKISGCWVESIELAGVLCVLFERCNYKWGDC